MKYIKKSIMTDLEFRKLFVSLAGLGFVLAISLIISFVFDIGLNSLELWIGALISYLTLFCYYILPLWGKVVTLFVSTFAISTFLFLVFNWSITVSIVLSFIPILIVFGIFTLL